jgi:hypothetical protein
MGDVKKASSAGSAAFPGMFVVKRDGRTEKVHFDKITSRIKKLCYGLNDSFVDPTIVAQKVCMGVYKGVTTAELDELAAETAAHLTSEHPQYGTLAARIAVSNLHKSTSKSWSDTVKALRDYVEPKTKRHVPMIDEKVYDFIMANRDVFNSAIVYDRDYAYDYFGFKTLERSYLLKVHGQIVERPQHMWMRVSCGIHCGDLEAAIETYNLMSLGWFTHASPTLFNAGTPRPQLSSCFVAGTLVCTSLGPKPIETVDIGDLVVTHTGSYKPVVQLHRNPLGGRKLYTLKCWKTPPIVVTGNHKLRVTSKKLQGRAEWVAVDRLTKKHFVMIPKRNETQPDVRIAADDRCGDEDATVMDMARVLPHIGRSDHVKTEFAVSATAITATSIVTGDQDRVSRHTHLPVKRFWRVTHAFAKALGAWFGSGATFAERSGHDEKVAVIGGIRMCGRVANSPVLDEWQSTLHETTGIRPTRRADMKEGTADMKLTSRVVGQLWTHMFGTELDGKRLHSSMFTWSKALVRSFMIGLMNTHGRVATIGTMLVELSNTSLALQIYHMCRQVGEDVSLGTSRMVRSGTQPTTVVLLLPRGWIQPSEITKPYPDDRLKQKHVRTGTRLMCAGSNTFVKVRSLEQYGEAPPSHVYTLGVEDDHSYNVQGLVAQNCYLLTMKEDSIDGIYETLKRCALISKGAGGIGLAIHDIRATGSYIAGTNGNSNGLVPMLRVFNNTARYVDQGGNKRKGAFATYLEPWHADIELWLDLKKNHGVEESRARDLFFGLWVPSLYMRRVEQGGTWSLFCPAEAPGLSDRYGDEFDALYVKYEKTPGLARRVVKARDLWQMILDSQTETGTPYILHKDAANQKSNQKNLGTIRCSNLCRNAETLSPLFFPLLVAVLFFACAAFFFFAHGAARASVRSFFYF